MAGTSEHSNARKGLIPFDPNWQRVARDEIYRQRVYGTESGASEFIPLNDKRKLSLLSLVVYIVFILATYQFVRPRVPVRVNFQVNDAIRRSLKRQSYETDPTPKVWNDIENTEDLRSWLLYAFPRFLTPEVQGFNFPIGAIRFTLRRIQEEENEDRRFKSLAPMIWKNKNGIQLRDETSDRDATEPFGAYRDMDPFGDNRDRDWEERPEKRCDGGELLDLVEEVRYDRATVVKMCKDWCEDLFADSKPCRCWTLSGTYKCEFYYMPQEALQNYSTSGLTQGKAVASSELAPRVKQGDQDVTVFWPRMKHFTYRAGQDGWRNTPGFVMYLNIVPQEAIIAAAKMASIDESIVPPTQSQVVFKKIRDWIEGGLLSRRTAGLAIDFVTFNPNLEVFTWIQLTFQKEASGNIQKDVELTSLRIQNDDRQEEEVNMWNEIHLWDVVYISLVVVYFMWEFWELGQRNIKYFYSGWNWLTLVSLVFHILTLATRYVYLNRSNFTKTLTDLGHQLENQPQKLWTTEFEEQVDAFQEFLLLSSMNLLFVWLKLVHYLNDIVPRIGVLVDTIYRSMTPIVFLVIILADMFFGFVIWANIMFGKSAAPFKNFTASLYSCMELLFGQVDSYYDLEPLNPVTGIIFFFVYMFTFSFVLQNLSKAIVLVSYDDASEDRKRAAERRQRAAESDSSDWLGKRWNKLQVKITRFFTTKVDRGSSFDKDKLVRKYEKQKSSYRKSSTCFFLAYCLMYMVMTYQQMQIYWANTLTMSLSSAIEVPTFEKTNPISGQVSSSNNFSTIETRGDVMRFLRQVLPKVMFNSSAGMFGTEPNPLNTYASALPVKIDQLVINNWNIIVGRTKPVRISTRYANMTKVGNAHVGSLVTADAMRTQSKSDVLSAASVFSPELKEARDEYILNPKTRAFLMRSCNYTFAYAADSKDELNGYECMLSRDFQETQSILKDMFESEFITNQTSMVAVDFVIYNGYAEAFVYVAITFGFQPSGAITKDITTFTIRLDLYNGGTVLRAMLEVCIILITFFYLGQSFSSMYRDVSDFRRESRDCKDAQPQTCFQRALSIFRGITLHLVLDPFNLLDLVSSVMTVVTMVLWYTVVLMKLREFYFPERPVWDPSQATSGNWRSDSDVIFEFYQAGRRLRWFIRVCAANTVIILFRLLKYLQLFPRVRMMFKTLARGIQDICYIILTMLVILLGYVTMGHQWFGELRSEFSTMSDSVIACFEMFLGTFDYAQLRQSDTFKYMFFTSTYMILFRFMLINMFFAIIDKSFQEEDKERESMEQERQKEERLEEQRRSSHRSSPTGEGAFMRCLRSLRQRLSFRGGHSTEESSHPEDESQVAGEGEHIPSHSLAPSEGTLAHHEPSSNDQHASDTGESDERGVLSEGDIKRVDNWKHLPEEMRTWALKTANDINRDIEVWRKDRKDCEEGKEQRDLDTILVGAENAIKDKTRNKWKEALAMKKELRNKELKKLKEIHQDQEALAWYIMKREAELKKLEQAKAKKQDRFGEIVQAAKSLISSGDDDGVKALEDKK
uniref:Polycystin cation channel PKD1/PKD2 domain-containing protein n=1 Tax=Pyrodinium bahamense TaxID=73915 RepID=A0A7S0FX01_9DINO|mmetsp:Transcript_52336/g.145000  ORF Transcript_52336/g.145000 Transcript_52336/m.145000 type:complete len:1533 (+) Transcript_52336:64-4662(+)